MDLDLTSQPIADHEDFLEVGHEFEQFANDLDDCLSPLLSRSDQRERILDLPRRYHENAVKRLAKLQPRKTRNKNDDGDMDLDESEGGGRLSRGSSRVKQVEREAQTWDLLRRVLPLRHQVSQTQTDHSRLQTLVDKSSASNTLQHFFHTNADAKERRAVLQWLQNNAASGPEIDELTRDLQQNADRGDIIAHGWLHTRSSIKLKKSMTGWPHLLDRQSANISKSHTTSTGDPLVTQLDPDACTRQGRKLQPQDEYFERAIWLGCFEHLRRGSDKETLHAWCQERTELWRAISLSALLLSGDDEDLATPVNPVSLTLWRRMCFGLARQGGNDDYERAVYGVLSGDISSVERVASSWDDNLFAHYNALLRAQIDHFLVSQCPPDVISNLTTSFPIFDAIQFHGEHAGVEKRLVRSFGTKESLKQEALEPHKALQAAIVGKEINEYLIEQGIALIPGADTSKAKAGVFAPEEQDGLRIVTHVYALVSVLERLDREEQAETNSTLALPRSGPLVPQENIIAQYTDLLRRAGLPELVPMYCALLNPPRLYEVLSDNLILVEQFEQQLAQLKLIKRANIDVVEFVQTQAGLLFAKVVQGADDQAFEAKEQFRILEEGPPTTRTGRTVKADFFGEDEDAVDPKHEHLIRSLEWLLLVDETWHDVFSAGTRIYKYLLRHMHLRAARRLMKRVPYSEVVKDTGFEDGDDAELDRIEFWANALERKGIDAAPERVMAEARNFRELERLVKALDGLETIASLVEISAEVPITNRDFWGNFGDLVKAAKDNMQPLLKNWLLAGAQDGDDELKDLRSAYLPETVMAYISALHIAGTSLSRDWLLECMELATIITERDSDILGLFIESKRVKELLASFAASSKALAIATGEKRATGTGSKKLRELGWSRDLWSIKS